MPFIVQLPGSQSQLAPPNHPLLEKCVQPLLLLVFNQFTACSPLQKAGGLSLCYVLPGLCHGDACPVSFFDFHN